MTKARDLADLISTGNPLADGAIAVSEVTGAAPLASPTFTGDVTLPDKIVHTGDTNTAIRFPANDTVAFETGGSERFRFGSSGQLGIGGATYGTSGQVLTSGGSGAAPSWADASGGGAQFDFTSDGAITAGKVVALTDTGKATLTNVDAIGSLQTGYGANNISASNSYDIAACPRTGRMLLTMARVDGNGIEHVGITESNGTLTMGSASNVGGASDEGVSVVPTGRADGEFVSFYRRSNTLYLVCRVFTVSSTRTLTNSSEYVIMSDSQVRLAPNSAVLASPTNTSQPSILVMHEWIDSSNYWNVAVSGVQVASNGTVSGSKQINDLTGSGGTGANATQDLFEAVYDSTNNRVITATRANNGNGYLHAFSISGTTITQLGTTNFTAEQAISVVYDGSLNQGVFVGGTSGGTVEVDSFTFNGSAFTIKGSVVTVQTGGYDARTADITYDSGKKKFIIRAIKSSNGYKHFITTGSFDSSGAITLDNAGGNAEGPFTSDPAIENSRHFGTYNPYNEISVLGQLESSSRDVMLYTYALGNADKYLGVANNTVSNNQTVTVNLKGSVDENQSGLTVGTIYFAGAAGGLSTSGTTRVGKALTATALQVTD